MVPGESIKIFDYQYHLLIWKRIVSREDIESFDGFRKIIWAFKVIKILSWMYATPWFQIRLHPCGGWSLMFGKARMSMRQWESRDLDDETLTVFMEMLLGQKCAAT